MDLIENGTQLVVYFIKPIKEFMERRNQGNYDRKAQGKQRLWHPGRPQVPTKRSVIVMGQPLSHKDK